MYDSIYDSAFRNIIFRNIIPQQLAPGRNGRESPLARLQIFVIQTVSFRFADTHVSVLKVDPFFNTQCLIRVRRTQAPVALTTQSPYIVLRVGTTSMYDFPAACARRVTSNSSGAVFRYDARGEADPVYSV